MSKQPLIVIVGAGPGVGAGVARKFGSRGFRVGLVARTQSSLDRLAAELKESGVEAFGIAADASDEASLRAAFARIKAEYGAPDALVYNAARIAHAAPSALASDQLIEDFKVNVSGALVSAQMVIPDMIERKAGALLITGGGLALQPAAAAASLSIGKAGVRSLAYMLADELKPHGIYVGTVTIGGYVRPGTFFDPDRIADVYWELYEKRDRTEVVFAEG